MAPEFAARSLRVWRASPAVVFARPPIMALPATAVQRAHECGTGGRLAGALRELLG